MDGEAIIINLSNGTYYSSDGIGGLMWECIEKNFSLKEMIALIVSMTKASQDAVEKDTMNFINDLISHNIISVSQNRAPAAEAKETISFQEEYRAPVLVVYDDMADLLALDPPMPDITSAPWQDSEDTKHRSE
jgi:hypothetical protein